jgi:lipoprotein-anchoring transpeptidase ErfK/SrfK
MSTGFNSARSAEPTVPRAVFLRLAFIALVTPLAASLAPRPVSALASGYQNWWAKTLQPTHLWSGPDTAAVDYGSIPQASYLLVVAPQQQARLYVYVPWTQNYAYVDAASVAPSPAPPPSTSPSPTSGQESSATSATWTGRVVADGLLVRAGPSVRSTLLRTDPAGTIVKVVAWVAGDSVVPGDWTWAKLVDGTYAYGEAIRIIPPTTPAPPPTSHPTGRWIDVNTLQQTVVAYEGDVPVHLAIASSGGPGWETAPGIHQILRRVADETMDSSTLFGLDPAHRAQANYHLTHVLYTQYFDDNAEGLHDNYWLPDDQFGVPHSHGCVGLRLADAAWFWNWASIGTPVVVHEK